MNPKIENNIKFIEDASISTLENMLFNIDFEMRRLTKLLENYVNLEESNSLQLTENKNNIAQLFECHLNIFNIIKIILMEKQSK